MSAPEQGILSFREQTAHGKGEESIIRSGASPAIPSVATAPENSDLSNSARKALRKKYKEDLLQEALGYPYALGNSDQMKVFLCFNDDEVPDVLRISAADRINREW